MKNNLKYDYVGGFYGNRARVTLNGKWGFIDENGTEIIPPKYAAAGNFQHGCAEVTRNGQKGQIDKKGKFSREK
jgi:hypothetical protein